MWFENSINWYTSMSYLVNPYMVLGVADIYPDSLGTDADAGTVGAVISTDEILGTGCLSFDGIDDWVAIGSASDWTFLSNGGAMSVSYWIKDNDNSQSSRVLNTAIMSGAGAGNGWSLAHNGDGSLGIYCRGDGVLPYSPDVSNVFTDSNWNHHCITFDGSTTLKFYLNASLTNTTTSSATFDTDPPTDRLVMGRRVEGSRYLNALLDDMVLFSGRVISASEVSSLYNSGSGALVSSVFGAGDRVGLKVYYNFDTLSGVDLLNDAVPVS